MDKTTTKMTRAWIVVAVLWVIAMLNYLDRLAITTMGDSIKVATWSSLTPTPDPLGVAAAFAGVSGDALVMAGGANFPDKKPWEGGQKVWHDKIFVLDKPEGNWIEAGKLSHPLAYGLSATYKDKVLCVGGSDASRNSSDVFWLKWNPAQRSVVLEPLPALPQPLANAAGTVVGSMFYCTGGETVPGTVTANTNFWALDLENPAAGWKMLPPCPGAPRILAGSASSKGFFFIAGGAELTAGPDGKQKRTYLKDVWRFDSNASAWTQMADMPRPLLGMPSPAATTSDGVFMFYGGDDGAEFALPPEQRTGFRRDVIRYDVCKNAWKTLGDMPGAARVTAPLVTWQGRHIVVSGEIRAGVRSPEVSHPITNASFGMMTSIFLWVYAFFSPLGGFLADRFGRKRVIIASLFVWSVVTWLTGHTHSLSQMLTARAIMGISEAFYIPAALAMIVDYHRGSTRSLATGIHMSGLYAGAAMGGLGGMIAEMVGWRACFSIFGFIGIGYSLFAFWLLKEAPHPKAIHLDNPAKQEPEKIGLMPAIKDLLSRGSFCWLLAYSSLLSMAFWVINGWLPTYLQEHFRLGQGAAGMNATFYIQIASFVGILLGGGLADRWSRTNVRGRLLVPAIAFMIGAPCLFMSASTNVLTVAIIGLIVFGIARGCSDSNLMPILCQVSDPRYRATGYGLLNFVGCVTGGIMIYVGGVIKDHQADLGIVFKSAAAGLLLAGFLLLLIKPRRELEQKES